MSWLPNDNYNEAEMEASEERFDECIRKINEHAAKIKAIDAKIAERRELFRKTGQLTKADFAILPLIW